MHMNMCTQRRPHAHAQTHLNAGNKKARALSHSLSLFPLTYLCSGQLAAWEQMMSHAQNFTMLQPMHHDISRAQHIDVF